MTPRQTRRSQSAARSAELQASALRQTRRGHSTETAEDYVEAIADLTAATGEARAVDGGVGAPPARRDQSG